MMFEELSGSAALSAAQPDGSGPRRENWNRPSRPESGRSLGASVTAVERPVREAISRLGRAVAVDSNIETQLFGCTVYGPGAVAEPFGLRLAWFVIASTLLHGSKTGNSATSTFAQALNWFTGDQQISQRTLACFSKHQVKAAERALAELQLSEVFWDLLPYVLEPHGHITRSDFENCDVAKRTRLTKKTAGVYYTPSDVADFMISSVAGSAPGDGNWLDPACGTGVFLRSIVRHQRTRPSYALLDTLEFVRTKLFAIDKSALATDLASFVLLSDCSGQKNADSTSFEDWKRVKANIICMDALRIVPSDCLPELLPAAKDCLTVLEAFPGMRTGVFDRVVMNPPYATVQIDQHLRSTWDSYRGMALGCSADAQLAFTEMLWRLTADTSGSAAVLPISIGTNTTKSYQRLRDGLLAGGGQKDFLFFDREPQALFGEDIKTRNVVLIRQSGLEIEDVVRSSRMLKWTSQQRPTILSRDRAVEIDPDSCGPFVPKIGSTKERTIYEALRSNVTTIAATRHKPTFSRVLHGDVLSTNAHRDTVLVSSTAYNFVNCFFADALPTSPPKPYSNSPINAIRFPNESFAHAGFAILSSRLCFWLWHVEGDGFHLTSDFLQRLPLWASFELDGVRNRLAHLGKNLWTDARHNAVGSVNGGKQTFSFNAGFTHPITLEIDALLLDALDIAPHAAESLANFIDMTVSIDGKRRSRSLNIEMIELK